MGIFREMRKIDKYWKVVEKSQGLEKIRLIVRVEFMGKKLLYRSGNSFGSSLYLPIMTNHQVLSDVFYSGLDMPMPGFYDGNEYNQLADEIYSDNEKRSRLSSAVYGAAFGVAIKKASDLSGAKINKVAVKEFVKASDCSEEEKKIIVKAATCILDCFEMAKKNGLENSSEIFAEIASLFLDQPLKEEDFIVYHNAVLASQQAIITAYRKEENNFAIKDAKECGLIG